LTYKNPGDKPFEASWIISPPGWVYDEEDKIKALFEKNKQVKRC
jgi:hypothetical protein